MNAASHDSVKGGKLDGNESLLPRVLSFAEFLRESGFEATTAETLDSVSCLLLVDIFNRDQFYCALRSAFVKRSDDYPLFDRLFKAFWGSVSGSVPVNGVPMPEEERTTGRARTSPSTVSIQSSSFTNLLIPDKTSQRGTPENAVHALYSPVETLGRRNLGRDPAGNSMSKRLVKRLSRRLASRPGRRFEASKNGGVDLRKTFRRGIGSGGQLTELLRKQRRISKADIVVLCDISGSMDNQSERLLRLLYYLCNTARAEVFAFSTQLVTLNGYLRGNSFYAASRLVSENVPVWSSGTRIGSALGKLVTLYSGYLTPSTVLVVISDGWELDDLDVLESNLREVKRRVRDIVWLNPLADSPDFRPVAAGMRVALPHIRLLAGLKALESRSEFDRAFGKELTPLSA